MTWQPGGPIATPQDAEEFAAVHMRSLGFTDATRTPTGPDGGVDVKSAFALGQVKQTAAQVGRPDVQRLVGARGRDHSLHLMFYSTSGYSRSAIGYADDMDIVLFIYDMAGVVTAANSHADVILARAIAHRATQRKVANEEAARLARATAPKPQASARTHGGFRAAWSDVRAEMREAQRADKQARAEAMKDPEKAKALAIKDARDARRVGWVLGLIIAIVLIPTLIVRGADAVTNGDGGSLVSVIVILLILTPLWFAAKHDLRKSRNAPTLLRSPKLRVQKRSHLPGLLRPPGNRPTT